MSAITLNQSELSRRLGQEVPEIYVIVAKHQVLDIESDTIAELIGVEPQEILELQKDSVYQSILLILKAEHSRSKVDAELGWDSLEDIALSRLLERVPHERDSDFLLKVAAVANKANRRQRPNNVLDPASAGMRVPLTLTSRIVKKMHRDGSQEVTEERQVSLTDGTYVNPTFGDVDVLLNVSQRPYMTKKMELETHNVADLDPQKMLDEVIDSESY